MRRELRNLDLFSQDVHGLNDDKFEKLLALMRKVVVFASASQEIRRKDLSSVRKHGFEVLSWYFFKQLTPK